MVDTVLRRSSAVDKESLCILAGQRVRLPPPLHLHVVVIAEEPVAGMAPPVDNTFPHRCGKLLGLCVLGGHRDTQALPPTRCRGHRVRSHRGYPESIQYILSLCVI
jgi:hypothetical protein